MARDVITIENTRFIFKTNFEGDPAKDRFGSDARKGNLIIPDYQQARSLIDAGFNVKTTKPKPGYEDEFIPTYYIPIRANYDTKWPPKIYLVTEGGEPVLLDEESVGSIDNVYVRNVNVVLNPYINQNTGRGSLYIRTMYVEQNVEDDPFAHKYVSAKSSPDYTNDMTDDDELPW